MHLHTTFNYNFQSGYTRFLEMEYRNIPYEKRTWYSSDREGYLFARGDYETVTLTENKVKLGTFTLEEFKVHFKDLIEKESAYIKKTIQIEKDNEERKKQKELLISKNIHPENNNSKPKTSFQMTYGNRYYVYNDKVYQIVTAKQIKEEIFSKYIEKPSKKEKEFISKVDFVVAKIQKPSNRCTEIKIPLKEFKKRKYYIDRSEIELKESSFDK